MSRLLRCKTRVSIFIIFLISIVCNNCFSAEGQTDKVFALDRYNSLLVTQNKLVSLSNFNLFGNISDATVTAEVSINDTMQQVDVIGKASWAGSEGDVTMLVLNKNLDPALIDNTNSDEITFIDQISPDEDGNFVFSFVFGNPPIPGEEYVVYVGGTYLERPIHVDFTYTPASLQEIKVNNKVIQGFEFNKTSYNYTLPVGTKDVPTIEVFTTDIGAEKIITNASSVTGITSVEVKSRDGSESQIYSIKFNQGECLNVISCENTTFLNEQSEPIVNLIGLKKVVGQLSFDNNTGENVDFTSIIVIYDSNNKLKKTKIIPVSIQKYQTASLQETLELPDDSGNYHIKIYLWDTLNNNRPLGIPFDFPG